MEILINANKNQDKIYLKDNKGEYYYSYITKNTLELLGQKNVDTNEIFIFYLKFLDTQQKEKKN